VRAAQANDDGEIRARVANALAHQLGHDGRSLLNFAPLSVWQSRVVQLPVWQAHDSIVTVMWRIGAVWSRMMTPLRRESGVVGALTRPSTWPSRTEAGELHPFHSFEAPERI
jgi:hypothetical protein